MLENTFNAAFNVSGGRNSVFAMYNDELPDTLKITAFDQSHYWWGHMKGIFAFSDDGSGFWVIHSIPKLSADKNKYSYPPTAKKYAQHMFCMNLIASSALPKMSKLFVRTNNIIVEAMLISRPLVQSYYLSDEVRRDYENIEKIMNHKTVDETNEFITDLLMTDNILKLKYFSKSRYFGEDIYADLVAPEIKVSLQVEGWRHGPGPLKSECDLTYHVENIERISWPEKRNTHSSFLTTDDHSKWAVSTNDDKWTCFGDINRMESQFTRGGGTVCIHDEQIWTQFNEIVSSIESCPE
ncbi:hypothetical protein Ciccas_000354 [Cichlidogyrus casuarinus]|uniref:Uncharacterized protein n=1 Tax=Cichlidogyrus casuarinus TaxID=1844966 RepID=A0ABD2QQH6_9PLAT